MHMTTTKRRASEGDADSAKHLIERRTQHNSWPQGWRMVIGDPQQEGTTITIKLASIQGEKKDVHTELRLEVDPLRLSTTPPGGGGLVLPFLNSRSSCLTVGLRSAASH